MKHAVAERGRITELDDRDVASCSLDTLPDDIARQVRGARIYHHHLEPLAHERGLERRTEVDARDRDVNTADAKGLRERRHIGRPTLDDQDVERRRWHALEFATADNVVRVSSAQCQERTALDSMDFWELSWCQIRI